MNCCIRNRALGSEQPGKIANLVLLGVVSTSIVFFFFFIKECPFLPFPPLKAEVWKMRGGNCNHLSFISYPRQWQITLRNDTCWQSKFQLRTAPTEKHSLVGRAEKGSGMVSLYHLCASPHYASCNWTSSKTFNF